MSAGAVGALVAAAAVLLAWPSSASPHPTGRWSPTSSAAPPVLLAGVITLGAVEVVATGAALLAVLGVILVLAALGAARIVALRRARAEAGRTETRVLDTCELMASELASGQPPGLALEHAAEAWPVLLPVAEAARVGADVPAAWRALDALPGAHGLRVVATAWAVAHRTGAGLAQALDGVALDLRQTQSTRRLVEGELASARATARLVAGLPVLSLAMGSGAGSNPWAILLGTPLGLGCLAGGLAFALAGLGWIELIARDVERAS